MEDVKSDDCGPDGFENDSYDFYKVNKQEEDKTKDMDLVYMIDSVNGTDRAILKDIKTFINQPDLKIKAIK